MDRRIKWVTMSLLLGVCLVFSLPVFVKSRFYSGTQFSQEQYRIKFQLMGDSVFCDKNSSYLVEGSRITIYRAGDYQFSGELTDGQIVVDAGKEDKVTLRLADANIHCETSAPILVKSADKVKIKLKKGTENYLSDGEAYEAVPDGEISPAACIYSRDDLTIKGPGSLTVESHTGNGIQTTDDLRIKSGSVTVKARKAALKGKDSVSIKDGVIKLQSDRDGIYSDKVLIHGGNVQINSEQYGIYGRQRILVENSSQVTIQNALSQYAGIGEKRIEGK